MTFSPEANNEIERRREEHDEIERRKRVEQAKTFSFELAEKVKTLQTIGEIIQTLSSLQIRAPRIPDSEEAGIPMDVGVEDTALIHLSKLMDVLRTVEHAVVTDTKIDLDEYQQYIPSYIWRHVQEIVSQSVIDRINKNKSTNV